MVTLEMSNGLKYEIDPLQFIGLMEEGIEKFKNDERLTNPMTKMMINSAISSLMMMGKIQKEEGYEEMDNMEYCIRLLAGQLLSSMENKTFQIEAKEVREHE